MHPDPSLPLTLARLHRETPVGAVVGVPVGPGDLLEGAGFAPAGDGRALRLRTLPDWVGPAMRLLVCGLNPSLAAADAGFGYAGRSNRFWTAALAAGVVDVARDPEAALAAGVGFTDLVKRATPTAAGLAGHEYRAGLERVARLAACLRPGAVVFVGLAGWRAAVDRRAGPGWQPGGVPGAGVPAYVMPSTSGLNARVPPAELAAHLATALGGPGRREDGG